MSSSQPTNGIDAKALYGNFTGHQKWKDDLHKQVCYKALNVIPDDDMNISVQTQKGMGWKELSAIGLLLAAGVTGGAFFSSNVNPSSPPPPAVKAPAAPPEPQPVRGTIRFWVDDADGTTKLGEQKVTP